VLTGQLGQVINPENLCKPKQRRQTHRLTRTLLNLLQPALAPATQTSNNRSGQPPSFP
jgi:hypothetical protein